MPDTSPAGDAAAPASVTGPARLWHWPYLLLPLTVLFWAGNFVVGKAVDHSVPPIALAFWRWALAGLIVLPFAIRPLRRDAAALRASWRILLLLATVGIAIFNTLIYVGLQTTTAINGLLLQSLMPVLIVLWSRVLFGERVTIRQALGIAVSLSGAVLIVTRGDPAVLLAFAFNRGDLWVAAAVTSYAAYTALLRLRPAVHPLSFLATTFLAGAALLLPAWLIESAGGRPLVLHGPALLAIAYVAVFPSIVSFLCYNRGVALIGANRAGVFVHLMPLFGTLMAVAFLGESFEPVHAAGLLLILAGIGLAARPGSGRR